MPVEFDYSDLKGRIIAKFKSQKAFAKACGISPISMSMKLTGQIAISQKDIVEWSKPELLDIQPCEYHKYYFKQKVHIS